MFYDQLTKLCNEKGIKLTPFVESLGMSRGNIEKWRKGISPNGDTLLKIADCFDVTIDYLLRGNENDTTNDIPYKKESGEMDIQSTDKNIKMFIMLPIHQKFLALRKELGLNIIEVAEKLVQFKIYYSEAFEEERGKDSDDSPYRIDVAKRSYLESFFDYPFIFTSSGAQIRKTDLSIRIGRRINKRIKDEQISLSDIANEIGVEEISLSSWATGERLPSQRCLKLLNGALELGEDILKQYLNDNSNSLSNTKDPLIV